MLFQKRVIDVVARVALVAPEIDRAANAQRQICVDLDLAAGIALVVIIATPALAGDQGKLEPLLGGQLDMLERPAVAFGDCRVHHGLDPIGGNIEPVLIGIDPFGKRTVAGGVRAAIRASTGS